MVLMQQHNLPHCACAQQSRAAGDLGCKQNTMLQKTVSEFMSQTVSQALRAMSRPLTKDDHDAWCKQSKPCQHSSYQEVVACIHGNDGAQVGTEVEQGARQRLHNTQAYRQNRQASRQADQAGGQAGRLGRAGRQQTTFGDAGTHVWTGWELLLWPYCAARC